jgi:uncharacterized protein YrrD
MRLREAVDRRIVARDSAAKIGSVKRFLVEPASATIVALEVGGVRGDRTIVDWHELSGFGPDAVVVPGPDSLRAPESDIERSFLEGRLDLDGKRILSEDGGELGGVQDVEFDERSGQVTAIETDDGRTIPVERLVAIGPYAVIVPA